MEAEMEKSQVFEQVEMEAKMEAMMTFLSTGDKSVFGKLVAAEAARKIETPDEVQIAWEAGEEFRLVDGTIISKASVESFVRETQAKQLVLFSPIERDGEIKGANCACLRVARYVSEGQHKASPLRRLH